MSQVCEQCGKLAELTCPKCKNSTYCSQSCFNKAWPTHKGFNCFNKKHISLNADAKDLGRSTKQLPQGEGNDENPLHYGRSKPGASQRCGNCKYFSEQGACSIVSGKIYPTAICDAWAGNLINIQYDLKLSKSQVIQYMKALNKDKKLIVYKFIQALMTTVGPLMIFEDTFKHRFSLHIDLKVLKVTQGWNQSNLNTIIQSVS